MASETARLRLVEPPRGSEPPFARVLVGFEPCDRLQDTLALARRLVDPSGAITVHGRLDGDAAADADADALVVPSAAHGPQGRICVDRRLLRLLHRARVPVAVAPAGHREPGPFHRVAIAFDGSPESRAALEAGYALAARDGAAVTLLRALPRIPDGVATDDERLQLRLRAQAELDAAADAAPAGVNPRARLLHGDPRKVLAEACDGLVDLVVCGSHGYGALQRAVLGSVSASLLAGASQPVLVIRSARAARAPD